MREYTPEELIEHFYPIYGDAPLSSKKIKDFAGDIARLLNMTIDGEYAIRDLLLQWMNRKLDKHDMRKIFLKVIFGRDHMNKGMRLGMDGLVKSQSAIKCTNAVENGETAVYSFIILEGALAGETRKNEFSHVKLMGLGGAAGLRGVRQREFHPRELVQFKLDANIKKEDGEIVVNRMHGGAYKDENATIKRKRKPHNRDCPMSDSVPCFLCRYGYDKCPLATHPVSWKIKECENCSKPTLHDSRSCIVCRERTYRDCNFIENYQEVI